MGKTKQKTKEVNKLKGHKGLKRLVPFYIKYKWLFTITLILAILSAVVSFFEPIYSAKALASISEGNYQVSYKFLLILLIVGILSLIINYFFRKCYVVNNLKVLFDIKHTLIDSITRVELSKTDNVNTGLYIERLNEDTNKCSDVLVDIMGVILELVKNLCFLIYIAFINIWFFLMISGYVIILMIIDGRKEYYWYKQRKQFRKTREISTGAYNEQIRSLRDIKGLNIRLNTIEDSNAKYRKAQEIDYKSRITRQRFNSTRGLVETIITIVVFGVLGIIFLRNKWITLSNFLIIFMYRGNIKMLSNYVSTIKQYATEGELAAQRVFEVVDKFPKEKFGNTTLVNLEGNVQLQNVTFAYNEEKTILNNLSLNIEPNQITAIVGKSGSGKTTILSLINKLYTVTNGHIFLDNVNINKLTEDCLRNNVGIVTQAPYIYNRTIKENMLLVKPNATDKEIIQALQKAQIYDFISSQPKGINSIIGENGVMLSGGQKQRIAIARIILKNSKIIMLDEATSALDNENQGKIVDVINELKKDHTIIIVAHRLSTIVDADKIIVLDKGTLVDQGTHKELFKKCPLYKELYKTEETTDKLESILLQSQN